MVLAHCGYICWKMYIPINTIFPETSKRVQKQKIHKFLHLLKIEYKGILTVWIEMCILVRKNGYYYIRVYYYELKTRLYREVFTVFWFLRKRYILSTLVVIFTNARDTRHVLHTAYTNIYYTISYMSRDMIIYTISEHREPK